MRQWRRAGVTIGLLGCLLVLAAACPAAAGDYLGDVCWSWAESHGLAGSIRAGLYHIGGGHYLLSGSFTQTSGGFYQSAISGNAEYLGGSYELTAIFTDRSATGLPELTSMNVLLDPVSLNGTFVLGIMSPASTQAPPIFYFANLTGTVTLVACP
jgi:hypothetical protein